MGSTLGSLQTAYSGLSAASLGIEVTGQNIANSRAPGYIREQVDTVSVGAPGQVGPAPGAIAAGQGTRVSGISQLGSPLLDAQVRLANGSAGFSGVRSDALSQIETALGEPASDAISGRLQQFWSAWQDVANQPGTQAPAAALIGEAKTLVNQIANTYGAMQQQWSMTNQDLGSAVAQVNAGAAQVADLNAQIRSTIDAGGSANALIVERNNLTAQLASLAGATVTQNADNTVNVSIGGTNIVQSTSARTIAVTGTTMLEGAATDPVHLVWSDDPSVDVAVSGGRIGGDLSLLASAPDGGAIAQTANDLNSLATSLATAVNGVATTATTPTQPNGTPGTTGNEFFHLGTGPAAISLSVVPTDVSGIGVTLTGEAVGSAADAISQLGTGNGSPDAGWAASVVSLGTRTQVAGKQAELDTSSQNAATDARASQESVDLDEENINLVAYQHAYQANARVLTALDAVFDQLINHTGIVGLS